MPPLCSSAEVNLLVYHYLKESGFHHASFSLRHESRLDDFPLSHEAVVEPGQLIRFLQKGLVYSAVEAHVQKDGTEKPCSAPFKLVGPPHVCDENPRPALPPASPVRLSPSPPPALAPPKSSHKKAAIQTAAAASSSTKLTNGVHPSTSSASASRRSSDDRDRSSKVASSSKKKLDEANSGDVDMAEADAASAPQTKEAKRKVSVTGAAPSASEREEKRAKREEPAPQKKRIPNGFVGEKDASAPSSGKNGKEESSRPTPPPKAAKRSESAAAGTDTKEKEGGKSKASKSGGENGSLSKARKGNAKEDARLETASDGGIWGDRSKREETFVQDEEITIFSGHTGEVVVAAWNPMVPNMLASGGADASARIWDLPAKPTDTPESAAICKHLPAGLVKDIATIHWNPDGTLLATGAYDGIVRLWTPQGDLHLVMSMHQAGVMMVKWSRKGNMLLSGSMDGTAIVWDLSSGKVRQQFSLHSDTVLDVDWLSTAEGSLPSEPGSSLPPPVPHGLSASVADSIFATSSADNSINICKLGETRPIKSFKGHTDEVNTIRFDPSQTLLASASDDSTARIWALELDSSGKAPSGGSNGVGTEISRKRVSRGRGGSANVDGAEAGDGDHGSRIEDGAEGEREKDRRTPTSADNSASKETPASSSAAAPSSSSLSNTVSSDKVGSSPIVTTSKGANKGLRFVLRGHTKEVITVAWCPTGPGTRNPDHPRMLATSGYDWTCRLWNGDTGECIRLINAHKNNVLTLCFSPCARFLVTGSHDKNVLISRVDNGQLVKQYDGHGPVYDVCWKDLPNTDSVAEPEAPASADANGSGDGSAVEGPIKRIAGGACRHRLAVSQGDRKLAVLHISDLEKSISKIFFDKRPPKVKNVTDEPTKKAKKT